MSPTEWIGSAFARSAGAALRFRKTVVVATLLATAAALTYAGQNLGINTDTADMISPELPWRRDFIRYRESFPARDRNLIVVVDGTTGEAADRFARELATALRGRPDLYSSAFLPGSGEFFERNGLLYLSLEELEQLGDRLAAAQPLLGLLQQRFNGAGLIDVVGRTLAESESADLEPLYAELARTVEDVASGDPTELSWRQLLTSEPPAARQLLLLTPALDFNSVQPGRAAIEGVRAAVAELGGPPAGVSVRLTGTVAMEHEELRTLAEGAGFASIASLVLVATLLFATLRSWRLLAIAIGMLLVGLSLTAAFAAATVGHLNLLSVAFAVLYVGLGVDYITHMTLRVKELRAAGEPLDAAVRHSAREIGSSLFVCAVTTSVAFFAFIPTSFAGVSELGLISGTGVVVSLLVAVLLLPAFLGWLGEGKTAIAARPWVNARVLEPLVSRPWITIAVSGLVVAVTFAALPNIEFDSNPINLRDPNTESVRTLRELASASDAPLLNLAAIAPNHATALEWAESLRGLPEVEDVVTVAALVPQQQAEKLDVIADIELILGPGLGDAELLPVDAAALESELRELGAALDGADAGVAAELDAAIERLLARVGNGTDASGEVLAALDRALVGGLPSELERLEQALGAKAFAASDLPSELRERWLTPGGAELIEIVPRENVSANAAADRFVASVRDVVPSATGLPVVYREASATIVDAFRTAFALAALAITVILWVIVRSLRDVLLILGPILLACGVTAGLTVYLGMPFNYANIITLPLLIGIGVDSGIHLVHRLRIGLARGERLFRISTSHAVLASVLTSVASFGNLAFSQHRGTASMGILLTLGMVVTIGATLIFLPSVLKLRHPI